MVYDWAYHERDQPRAEQGQEGSGDQLVPDYSTWNPKNGV